MSDDKNNIERELLEERERELKGQDILAQVNRLFEQNDSHRNFIRSKIAHKDSVTTNDLRLDLLTSEKIFHISQIQKVCIDYRLRFLESRYFRHSIPEEAITKIRELESEHKVSLEGFMIMAPTKAFTLVSEDDPFLFVPIGEDYYYLVHRWGKEITRTRKWLVKPFRNLVNFLIFSFIISVIVTLLTPETNLSRQVSMAGGIIFLFAFKTVIAVLMYSFFMLGKNFNSVIWNRKYYNN